MLVCTIGARSRSAVARACLEDTQFREDGLLRPSQVLSVGLANLKHRITNAASESINSKIQWVKYTAGGFRNKQNFISAIYFHCGGLDLAPAATK